MTKAVSSPPLSGWRGGKSQLSKIIIPKIPEHTCYVEPFAGAAWVFWKKEESKVEVLNDINKDLITLYRVIQNHLEEFVRYFKWSLISRDEFYRLKTVNPDTLTDIQRAARFYYLQRNAFGGKIEGCNFGYATTRYSRLNLLRIEEELSAAHIRLAQTYIECLNYDDIIKRYDKPHTFFYIDPPYWNCEKDYGKEIFAKADFLNLADILRNIQGKFLLSLNDVPEVREIFAKFRIEEVNVQYTCSKIKKCAGKGSFNNELLKLYYKIIKKNLNRLSKNSLFKKKL